MPHPKETMMRESYAAFASQDIPQMLSIWDPNITWTEGGHGSLTGTHKGTDEVLTLLGHVGTVTDGTFALAIERVVADDSRSGPLQHQRLTQRQVLRLPLSSSLDHRQRQADRRRGVQRRRPSQ